MKEFEFIPVEQCILCDSKEFHPVRGSSFRGIAFSYTHCLHCGLKQMNPQPTPQSLERFFREDYWQDNLKAKGFPTGKGYDDSSIDQMALRMPKYEKVYTRVRSHLKEIRGIGPQTQFLEIGCGFGYTLEWLARDDGCQVFGVEPSDEAIARCEEAQSIKILARTAEEFFLDKANPANDAQPEQFDVILFRHCLETLLEPHKILGGVRERLKSDGLLMIYTSNLEYHNLMSPFSAFVYTKETLSRLLAVIGFEVEQIIASPSPDTHAAAVAATPHYELVIFARPGEKRRVEHPRVDLMHILKTIERGESSKHWHKLSAADLMVLLQKKIKRRVFKK